MSLEVGWLDYRKCQLWKLQLHMTSSSPMRVLWFSFHCQHVAGLPISPGLVALLTRDPRSSTSPLKLRAWLAVPCSKSKGGDQRAMSRRRLAVEFVPGWLFLQVWQSSQARGQAWMTTSLPAAASCCTRTALTLQAEMLLPPAWTPNSDVECKNLLHCTQQSHLSSGHSYCLASFLDVFLCSLPPFSLLRPFVSWQTSTDSL